MQKINLSLCNIDGQLSITMRLIADLENILGYDNFLQFHHDICNLSESKMSLHNLLDAGEYLLQQLGYEPQKAASLIDTQGQKAIKDIIMALSNIVMQYAGVLSKSSNKNDNNEDVLSATPWSNFYQISCGMMGWSENDLMNASPETLFSAIEGFRQFHSTGSKKSEEKDPQSLIDSFKSF